MTDSTQKIDLPRVVTLPGLSVVRTIRRWLRYRKNLREIAGLDANTLRDIGTNEAELVGHAWRDACGEHCVRSG